MSINVGALNGRNGFTLDGVSPGDNAGQSVASAGDFNNDGYADLIVGAYMADPGGKSTAGETYIVYGGASTPSNTDLSSLNGKTGFRIDGQKSGDNSGYTVNTAGDFNGDGFDDVIIGAPFAAADGKKDAGEAYILFGSANTSASSMSLNNLNGNNGFRIDGMDAGDRAGWNVAPAGDVNGDGLADVIIGAHFADANGNSNAGEAYVLYGSKNGYGSSFDLANLNGRNGFRLDGIDADDFVGKQVASAGDINGDGFDDVIIGGRGADADGKVDAGETYVVFGSGGARAASLDLDNLNGNNGFRLDGIAAGDRAGRGVSSAGDFNGDGYDDIAIGGWTVDPLGRDNAGETYVIYGSKNGFPASLNLNQINGNNGVRIPGAKAGDESGRPVAPAGDVNGDGIDDLLIGAGLAGNGAGKTYVLYGNANGHGKTLDLAKLTAKQGFVIDGAKRGDEAGRPAAPAGDVNGDGYDDIAVGATYARADGKANAGQAYVIYGGPSGPGTAPATSSASSTSGGTSNTGSSGSGSTATTNTTSTTGTTTGTTTTTTSGGTTSAGAVKDLTSGTTKTTATEADEVTVKTTNDEDTAPETTTDTATKADPVEPTVDADPVEDKVEEKVEVTAEETATEDTAAEDTAKTEADTESDDDNTSAAPVQDIEYTASKSDAAMADEVAEKITSDTGKTSADPVKDIVVNDDDDAPTTTKEVAPATNQTTVAVPDVVVSGDDDDDDGLTDGITAITSSVSIIDPVPTGFDAVISGGAGSDRLRGTSADEYIEGGAGRDKILGGAGDDYISAGEGGAGHVRGGEGADTFEFAVGFKTVKIFDFVSGTDKIDLTGGLTFADLRVNETSYMGIEKTSLWTEDGDRLVLHDFAARDLDANDFI